MTSKRSAYVVLVVGLLVVFLWAGGCHHDKTPGAKQARLIAAENIQLEAQLADCRAEIAKLEERHAEAVKKLEDELAACRKRNDLLRKDLEEGIAERADSVTATVMAENVRLRAEIKRLKEQN